MLKIIASNEQKMSENSENSSIIEGYISEVLHREFLNVATDLNLDSSGTCCFSDSTNVPSTPQNGSCGNAMIESSYMSNQSSLGTMYTPIKTTNCNIINKSINMPSVKPQIIKLQPMIPSNGSINQIPISQSANCKNIIYLPSMSNATGSPNPTLLSSNHSSPIKQNKLIKISNHHLVNTSTNINLTNDVKTEHVIHDPATLSNNQQPQVLNLVLVTDSVNGNVSYLSLLPQNNSH
jgi:hypothetical protein